MKALQREAPRRFPHAGDFAAELKLVRLSAERGAETQADRVAGSGADDLHPADAWHRRRAARPLPARGRPSVDPAGMASMASEPGRRGRWSTGQSRMSTWLLIAAVAIAAVALAVALTGRAGRPGVDAIASRHRRRGDRRRRAPPAAPPPCAGAVPV